LELIIHYNFILIFILILNINFHNSDEFDTTSLRKYYFNSTGIKFYQKNSGTRIIFFLPNDCQISIEAKDNRENPYFPLKISNYYYDGFYLNVHTNLNFKINPLILSRKERNQNRNYSLLKITLPSENRELPIIDGEPIFLYFNRKTLTKTQLLYLSQKDPLESPIIISFFIKEKQNFNIDIFNNYDNTQINRSINYKENILIEPKSEAAYFFSITANESIINATMFANIIQNYSSPIYLQKNQLNLGFIPINVENYYYYMEVFKGEEGEIMLFNKRQNGILISRIIEKNSNIPKVELFPNFNKDDEMTKDYLDFNIYNQRLSFNSSYTKNCETGCFLLITYYSNISNSVKIKGTEFSLLSRIWDEEELISQIINITLNEYIFGFFDKATIILIKFILSIFKKIKNKNINN
jgi:hypothetical protein